MTKSKQLQKLRQTYREVVLDPGVRGLPVLQANVAVHVASREVLRRHGAALKVSLWRKIPRDTLKSLAKRGKKKQDKKFITHAMMVQS